MDINKKVENIKEFEERKKEVTEHLTQYINDASKIIGRMYKCHVDCKVEINIIPIEDKK